MSKTEQPPKKQRTAKQREASRRNGKQSKGPLTAAGKAISSRNHTVHGLCAYKNLILNNESPHILDILRDTYIDRYQPADPVELDIVEQMVSALWRLRRYTAVEVAVFDDEMARQEDAGFVPSYEGQRCGRAFKALAEEGNTLPLLGRYQARLTRDFYRARKSFFELRRELPPPPGSSPIPRNTPPPIPGINFPIEPELNLNPTDSTAQSQQHSSAPAHFATPANAACDSFEPSPSTPQIPTPDLRLAPSASLLPPSSSLPPSPFSLPPSAPTPERPLSASGTPPPPPDAPPPALSYGFSVTSASTRSSSPLEIRVLPQPVTSRSVPMLTPRSILALILALLMVAPVGLAQVPAVKPATPMADSGAQITVPDRPIVPVASGTGLLSNFTRPYRQPDIGAVNLTNTTRIEQLLRAGKLYLSLQDAIALSLENNLDIELGRYGPQIAQADYLRAKGGGLLRGVPTSVRAGASSALSQAGVSGGGQGAGASGQSGAGDAGVGGTVITQTGVAVPTLDPSFYVASSVGHVSRPQANTVTTGLTAIAIGSKAWNAGYTQNFLTGSNVTYSWSNSFVSTNNAYNDLNPNTSSNMRLEVSQRLLQGFGLAVNNRNIRVAKNDIRLSDLVFKSQVMTTVSAVVNLYWDLVSYNEDVKVRRKALEVAEKFYSDNKKQVEIGTLAPIEIIRAEARVAQAQQDLTNADTVLLQQETILKNALSRTGVASQAISDARVVPLDSLTIPANEPISPLPDLIDTALKSRPDVEQTRINLDNTRIAIAGSRSALQPSLDVAGTFQNNALTGAINAVPFPPGRDPIGRNPNEYFIGGYGNALSQIFRRNFPDYSFAFQLNVPLRNRVAQADYIRDRLTLRQQEINQQRQLNDIRVSVQNALTAVTQARARYQVATKERQLQEQTLDAENKKYALGASTAFQVVQTQRDLAQAQATEVSALAAYSRARIQLDLATAQILDKYGVEISEALKGTVAKPPSPIPSGL